MFGFVRVVHTQRKPMPKDTLEDMNGASAYQRLFSNSSSNSRSHELFKVHLVVVDGDLCSIGL